MKLIKVLIPFACVLVSACSSWGNKDFECNAPVNTTCQSSRDIYEQTNGGGTVFNKAGARNNQQYNSRDGKKAQPLPPKKIKDPVVDTFVAPQLPDSPVPVLTPAVVMRVKVYSYEDQTSGALYAPGFVFVEVQPRHWTIGKPESDVPYGRHASPLEADTSNRKLP